MCTSYFAPSQSVSVRRIVAFGTALFAAASALVLLLPVSVVSVQLPTVCGPRGCGSSGAEDDDEPDEPLPLDAAAGMAFVTVAAAGADDSTVADPPDAA